LYKKSLKNDRQLLTDSADMSDRQPAFLKDKGDALYKQGNYRSVLSLGLCTPRDMLCTMMWKSEGWQNMILCTENCSPRSIML
jgi:hypothetical protein